MGTKVLDAFMYLLIAAVVVAAFKNSGGFAKDVQAVSGGANDLAQTLTSTK